MKTSTCVVLFFLALYILAINAGSKTSQALYSNELVQAVLDEDFEKVQLLVKQGADINLRNRGESALHVAIKTQRMDIVKFLVENGADVNKPNITNELPAQLAILHGTSEIVDYLLRLDSLNLSARNSKNDTIMHTAAGMGHLTATKTLTDIGYKDWNAVNEKGNTPLHVALKKGYLAVAWLLVKMPEANVNQENRIQIKPFFLACTNDDVELVKYLKEVKNADDSWDKNMESALHVAVQNRRFGVVKYLIDQLHYEVDSKDYNGWTPLHYAAWSGEIEIFDFLMKKGANPLLVTSDKVALPKIVNETLHSTDENKWILRKKLVPYFPELLRHYPELSEKQVPLKQQPQKKAKGNTRKNVKSVVEKSSFPKDEL